MGQKDEIMMKARPSGYMYTPITRGHKPTPSQESNTLSEASCTTTISTESGTISPTYREEDEEDRLHDFQDDDDYDDRHHDHQTMNGAGGGLLPPTAVSERTTGSLDSRRASREVKRGRGGGSSSELSEVSGYSGGGRSSSGGERFRDSCDTVVRVCVDGSYECGTPPQSSSTPHSARRSDNNIHGMPREAKSANSDYGSFCATPDEVGHPAPKPPVHNAQAAPSTAQYQRVETNSADQADNSIISGDLYQRAPLLSDSDPEDEAGTHAGGNNNNKDRAAPHKIPISSPTNTSGIIDSSKIPSEPLKTLLSGLFLASGFVATTASLAITHERVPEIDPLPDMILDSVPYQQWGLDVSEIIIMISTLTAFLVVMLHYHRLIILRRIWFLLGCLYYYRAITMFVTVLPKADPSYTCKPKVDNTTVLPGIVIAKRILTLMSGMGLSINGKHIYCGDYIFSGHTMVLTMGYLVIKEYSPRRFVLLHWVSFFTSLTGIIMLLIARGHYSIDCLLAYYVTTRMWWIYHTLAHNNSLKTRGSHNFLDQMWWWRVFKFFERKIDGPLPRKYSVPLPRRVKTALTACFRSRCSTNQSPDIAQP